MGPKDNAMTRDWKYLVGQTIQEHVYILEVDEKFERLAQTGNFFEMTDGKERREGQAEFFSHHAQSLHMGPKDNAMTSNIRAVGQTIQEHVYILEVGEKFERYI